MHRQQAAAAVQHRRTNTPKGRLVASVEFLKWNLCTRMQTAELAQLVNHGDRQADSACPAAAEATGRDLSGSATTRAPGRPTAAGCTAAVSNAPLPSTSPVDPPV